MNDSEKLDYIYQWICSQETDIAQVSKVAYGDFGLPFDVYPKDLPETMTYLDAVEAVKNLGDGWYIPTLNELRLMYINKDRFGGFCTAERGGSDFPCWYWSSTEDRDNSSDVLGVRFSGGSEGWFPKDDYRLSCRPVRLVAAPSLPRRQVRS
jgi:hypothetical protein